MSGARRSCPAAPAGPRGASSTKRRRVAPQPAPRSAATERQLLDSLLLQIRDEVSSLTGAALSYELRGCQRLPKPETHTAAKVERHTGELLGALEGCLAKATRAHAAARRLSDAERRQREAARARAVSRFHPVRLTANTWYCSGAAADPAHVCTGGPPHRGRHGQPPSGKSTITRHIANVHLAHAAGAVVDRYRALSTTSAALAGWVE